MKQSGASVKKAIREWEAVLGKKQVLLGSTLLQRYTCSAEGIIREIPAALLARNLRDVVAAVRTAHRHSVPIYPVSTGRNWGYGSSLPVVDGSVILDLSNMNRILDFDSDLGLVTIEPGVTQRQLHEYLIRRKAPYLLPVTDAGPDSSVAGTILERGLCITVQPLLFLSLASLEAVLPSGEVSRHPYPAGTPSRWGAGPYLSSLFSQGNLGIVTQLTLALPPKPETAEIFSFQVPAEKGLERVVEGMQEIRQALGGMLNFPNLVNPQYAFAMSIPYPWDQAPDGFIPLEAIRKMCRAYSIPPWLGGGAIYGNREMVVAARHELAKTLSGCTDKLTFISRDLLEDSAGALSPERKKHLEEIFEHLLGKPIDFPLKLAYWKSGEPGRRLNPGRDGCGILWYAPLVSLVPRRVREYVEMVKRTCTAHRIDPLFTLVFADSCLFGIVPVLFNPGKNEEMTRAFRCYEALFKEGKSRGFLPYRVPVHAMKFLVDPSSPAWNLIGRVKEALDPRGILAPGRYSPLPSATYVRRNRKSQK